MDRPFVIITNQRTGGSNFTKILNRSSSFNASQHEPFNAERIYGHLANNLENGIPIEKLFSDMRKIISKQENIKHCFEILPKEITMALIKASAEKNYAHIFLYRERVISRMLSVEYARRTGIWGPKLAKSKKPTSYTFDIPLDVEKMVNVEGKIIRMFNHFWRICEISSEIQPIAISYEDIYEADAQKTLSRMRQVFERVGLRPDNEKCIEIVNELRARGDQNTRHLYNQFKGIEHLKEMVDTLPPYLFQSGCS